MQRRTAMTFLFATALLAANDDGRAQSVPSDVASSLAPTGTLRFAINYGNAVLANRDPQTGKLSGVSVDIAEELGRRLGLPITLVPFDAAGKVSAAAAAGVWDVAFLGRDPERAKDVTFTAPYVVIDGTYVVRKDSPINTVDQVDRDGVRVAVSDRSAYDLHLSRTLKHAKIIRGPGTPGAVAIFLSEKLEVLAGVKQALQKVIAEDATLRMIATPFMEINQAMGMPAGRPAGAVYLRTFVEDIKASGFVKKVLERNAQIDAAVAPPG